MSEHSHESGVHDHDDHGADDHGICALKLSLLALGITAFAQLAVVLVSGSVALLADTIHNFSDALTVIPLWIAFAIGSRAAIRRYTAVIHVNPCGPAGEDAPALTRHHDAAPAGGPAPTTTQGAAR